MTLSLRAPLDQRIEMDVVAADRFAGFTAREIAALPVWLGAHATRVGEFFDIRGERSSRVRIEGSADDLARIDGLAAAMAGGELLIDGDAGRRVGAGMTGGRVDVRGNAGDDAGAGMAGGVLWIGGRAGDRLGAATPGASKGMTGGEIVVVGSAGDEVAARMRRGLVVVNGEAGADAGRAMIAGTLVVLGRIGSAPGRGNKRGSIVAIGPAMVPPTYRYACTFRPPHVRLVLAYLRRRYGLAVDDRALNGHYRRYCGEAGPPGKGEILQWIGD